MLTTLDTLKTRLNILDTSADDLLTAALSAISVRFDHETNRTLARTENFTQGGSPGDTEIIAACYPIELVTKFEYKRTESEGWIEIPGMDFLIRHRSIIHLTNSPFIIHPSSFRVTYTAGYVLPGDPDPAPLEGGSPPVRLPADLESAAVEQIAFWFSNRDRLGLKNIWEYHGTYRQFATLDLLPSVLAVLEKHRRFSF
jgi:Phage gp6-like head-tail connector protein